MNPDTAAHFRRRRLMRPGPVPTVLAGGLVGSGIRAGFGELFPARPGTFPTAVLVINLSGSFLLGLYLVRRERSISGPNSLRFWAIGVLGSLTTFSAFSVEVVELVDAGHPVAALWYVAVSTIGGLVSALTGLRVGAVSR